MDAVGGELVDPVGADPVAQDSDKRNNATTMYTTFLFKNEVGEGTELPHIFISCRCLDGPVSFAICRASHYTVMEMLRNFGPS